MRKKHNEPYFNEYFVNDSKLKILYGLYVKKKPLEKMLNVLVFFAIIFTLMGAILNFLMDVNTSVLVFINSFSLVILLIFILELLRDYADSKTKKEFFKHHWIDVILIAFLSLYFLFLSVFFVFQFLFMDTLKPIFQEAKDSRLLYRLFRK